MLYLCRLYIISSAPFLLEASVKSSILPWTATHLTIILWNRSPLPQFAIIKPAVLVLCRHGWHSTKVQFYSAYLWIHQFQKKSNTTHPQACHTQTGNNKTEFAITKTWHLQSFAELCMRCLWHHKSIQLDNDCCQTETIMEKQSTLQLLFSR